MGPDVTQIKKVYGPLDAERLKRSRPVPASTDFKDLFNAERNKLDDEIRFSAHAQLRLNERNIVMTPEDNQKLRVAMQKIRDSGGKESLVLMRDVAFLVSAPNRTVITAMDSNALKNHVFTNIDSAVII